MPAAKRRTIWIRGDDQPMWEELDEFSGNVGDSISEIVAAAVRDYEPFRIYRIGKEAGMAEVAS